MMVEVREVPLSTLEEYATIPIAFEVHSILDVQAAGNVTAEFILTERRVDVPYLKDYDSIDGGHPTQWPKRFDLSHWVCFAAWGERQRVGGAVVAFRTPSLTPETSREAVAVLWDLRVSPAARGQGVGAALFRAVEARARTEGVRQLEVETQNINVGACRFYARQGCILRGVKEQAYAAFPDEIQFLWYKELSASLSSV